MFWVSGFWKAGFWANGFWVGMTGSPPADQGPSSITSIAVIADVT